MTESLSIKTLEHGNFQINVNTEREYRTLSNLARTGVGVSSCPCICMSHAGTNAGAPVLHSSIPFRIHRTQEFNYL